MDTWLSQAVFDREGIFTLEGKVLEPQVCGIEAFDRGEIIIGHHGRIYSKLADEGCACGYRFTLGILDEPYTKCVAFGEALQHLRDGGMIKHANWDECVWLIDGNLHGLHPDYHTGIDFCDILEDEWILG